MSDARFRGGRGKELPDDEEYQLWLVWKLDGDPPRPILVAIDTSEDRAQAHVASVRHSVSKGMPVPETFVEDSLANHLYGMSIDGTEGSLKIAKLEQKWRKERDK